MFATSDQDLHRWFIPILLCLAAFRLLLLWILPLNLSGDEAYYWEWGQHLDWGYLSKPPGIAWLMAFAGFAGGDTTFGIRFFAVLLGTAGLWLLYELGRRMYNTRTGIIAALVFALTPANAALNFLLTIDAPLMLCWTGALLCFWQLIQSNGRSLGWALALAAFLASGVLIKQMMLVFFPLMAVALIFCREYRGILKSAWYWLALVLSLTALLPPLYWNQQNGWVTVSHTLHHFGSGSPTILTRAIRFLEFGGAGLGLLTPVICVLMMVVIVAPIFDWKRLGPRERLLWVFCGPGILVMILLTLHQRIIPNWPAVFLPAGMLLMASWYGGFWSFTRQRVERWKNAFPVGLGLAFVFFCSLYFLLIAFSLEWIPSSRLNPMKQIKGLQALAGEVAASHAKLPDPEQALFITQGHRFLASQLAFYLPGNPRVYRFNPNPAWIESQHDLWESPAAFLGHDALLVVEGGISFLSPELSSRFDEVTFIKELDAQYSPKKNHPIGLFWGRNLRGWPEYQGVGQSLK